jgi:signal transduction histidine kinase
MGVVIGVLAVLSGLLGAGLHAANAAAGRTSEPSFWLMGLAAAVAYGLACLLLRVSDARRVRLLLGLIGLTQGLAMLGLELGLLTPDSAVGSWSTWLGAWLWAPGYVAIAVLLPVLLPDGRPRRRPVLWLTSAAVVVIAVTWALTPYDAQDFPEALHSATNPVGVAAASEPVVTVVGGVLLALAVVAGFASLVVRWRQAADIERQQLKWVLVGYACTVVLFGVARLVPIGVAGVVVGVAMLPLPLAIGFAVMRYGLWDVDIVISRGLVYGGLSAVVIGFYALTVWLVGDRLGARTGAPILATTGVALAALPLRSWLQRHVNRLVHGDVEEPYAVLARLGTRLAAATTPDDLSERVLPSVLEQVARSLRAQQATIVLSDGLVTSYGEGPTTGVAVDLEYAGERSGRLTVARSTQFDGYEVRALHRLAAQAAVAAHTVLLAREAQRAREAVVVAREEERRRLRRDLHDGVGPSLAALALHVETARDIAADDPEAARQLLDRLVPRLNAAVADVRAMVHELRPPMLDELGLAAAVRELGDRLSTGTTKVRVRADEIAGLPAAVEVAAYHIAGEATGNAVRHAGATTVAVQVAEADGCLRIEVADDGRGLPDEVRPGVGTSSMRERAEELGGQLTIDSGPSGTTVTALLPRGAP